jgi:tetratricopeptide (TPR) repeat protein
LWQAAADKAPNQARPLINLAWGHYQKKGHYQEALKLYGQSLKLESQKPVYTKAATLSNMGGIYFLIEHYDKAIDSYREALQLFPKHEKSRYWMAMALAAKGELNEAEKNLRILLTKRDDHKDYLNLTGFILLKKGRPQQAIPFFRVAMSLAPNDRVVLFNLGVSLSRLGGYTNADWFLRRAHQMHPADALPIFCLLENSIRAKKGGKIRHYVQVLLNRYSPHQIHEMLGQIEKGHLFVPVATNLIAPHIPPAVTKSNWVGQRADISRPSL